MNGCLRANSAGMTHFPPGLEGIGQMLARRFTIVCLMTALFGMFFASLAARSEGPGAVSTIRGRAQRPFIRSFDC